MCPGFQAAAGPAAWLLSLRAEALRPGGGLTLQVPLAYMLFPHPLRQP